MLLLTGTVPGLARSGGCLCRARHMPMVAGWVAVTGRCEAAAALTVRTVPVPDPGDLLARLPGSGALAWVRRGDGLVAWGEAARITLPAGEDRFTVGEQKVRGLFGATDTEDRVGVPGCGPVAFGSFTFDAACGGSVLVVPQAVTGRRAGTSWDTTITAAGRRSRSGSRSASCTDANQGALAWLRSRGPRWGSLTERLAHPEFEAAREDQGATTDEDQQPP